MIERLDAKRHLAEVESVDAIPGFLESTGAEFEELSNRVLRDERRQRDSKLKMRTLEKKESDSVISAFRCGIQQSA